MQTGLIESARSKLHSLVNEAADEAAERNGDEAGKEMLLDSVGVLLGLLTFDQIQVAARRLERATGRIDHKLFAGNLAGYRTIAEDINGKPVSVGDRVVCVNDKLSYDDSTDELETGDIDLVAGLLYTVARVHDEPGLDEPMLVVEVSGAGAVRSERFIRIIGCSEEAEDN